MNQRFTISLVGLFLIACITAVGCAGTPVPPTVAPAPTTAATAVPATVAPTTAPTRTALPPTPTTAPTITLAPATNTPIPTTPAPTATNTRPPVTRAPATATVPTATKVALKYPAPQLIEPGSGDTRKNGSDDLVFRWQPVAPLTAPNECYLVTVRITNTIDSQYAEQSYIAENTCNDSGTAPLQFSLHRRAPAPDYAGLVAIASTANPSTSFKVTWNVMVVQNNGADPNKAEPANYIPLSPPSETLEFNLVG